MIIVNYAEDPDTFYTACDSVRCVLCKLYKRRVMCFGFTAAKQHKYFRTFCSHELMTGQKYD